MILFSSYLSTVPLNFMRAVLTSGQLTGRHGFLEILY